MSYLHPASQVQTISHKDYNSKINHPASIKINNYKKKYIKYKSKYIKYKLKINK